MSPVAIDLSGHTALVTGASRNIGRSIALALAAAGAEVAVLAHRDSDRLARVVEEIQGHGVRGLGVLADAGDWDSLAAGLEEVKAAMGAADIVVNNVGIRPAVRLADVTREFWDRVLAVNLRSAFQCVQWAVPGMVAKEWGRIVNISGQDALAGSYFRVPVTAAKAGLIGLTGAVAPEFAGSGITVNTVVPGFIDTERHTPAWYPDAEELFSRALDRVPAKRLGTPDEVAALVRFLASDHAAYITGQTVNVTGGFPILRRREWEDAVVDPPEAGGP